jgi:two-component system LytT family response regulator
MKIKALIIDDEKHCIITLQHLISQIESIEIVATTQDSLEAKTLINLHKPDIVFLDIEMPNKNGFEVLEQFETLPFKVVFTTAYDQYAVKAIKMNALDYLLKPIGKEELEEVIEKFKQNQLTISKEQLHYVSQFIQGKMKDTLAIATQNGMIFIKIDEIMYLEASSCYTFIIMNNNSQHLASKTMQNFEEVLQDNPMFFRIHKSHMIHLKYIKQYIKGEGGEIIMENGKNLALSRTKKQEFLNFFNKI